jgi:hypothetical protein
MLRKRLNHVIKGRIKTCSAIADLGCTPEELMDYLEERFYDRSTGEEMTWDNYSHKGWHVDHIFPLSRIDTSNTEQLKAALHYTNLQPLWAEDNMKKGASIISF